MLHIQAIKSRKETFSHPRFALKTITRNTVAIVLIICQSTILKNYLCWYTPIIAILLWASYCKINGNLTVNLQLVHRLLTYL